jgi:uncharacterized membrane protein
MSAIVRSWKWIAAALAVAAAVHVASVLAVPRLIMWRTMTGMAHRAGGVNRILHTPRPTAAARGVVRPSPDLFYSTCAFDLDAAGGAVRVHARGMPATYWSVSAFDADTDNFYVVNDRKTGAAGVDFLIIAPGAFIDGTKLPVVVAPTTRGIVLFRTLISDERHVADIDRARRGAACEPFVAAAP